MNKEELKLMLQEGEGYKIEFKESLSNIDKDIVAFANSSGGRIFVGVTDKGEIKGIKVSNKIKTKIQDIANITFRQSREYLRLALAEATQKTVEKTVEKILLLMKENPKITISELSKQTGLSRRGVEWNIEKLKKEGRMRRIGGRKGGHWEVLK